MAGAATPRNRRLRLRSRPGPTRPRLRRPTARPPGADDVDDVRYRLLDVGVVRHGLHDRDVAGATCRDAVSHQLSGVDEQARAHPFLEAVLAQVPHLDADGREAVRGFVVHPGLVGDDRGFHVPLRVVEVEAHEALPRARLQVLQDALVAGVVGDHQQEVGMGGEQFPGLVDGEHAAVVRERVDEHRGVLARLDDLVEVADRALADRVGQGAVLPDGLVAAQQEPAHQVRRREVLMAGHGDQWVRAVLPGRRLFTTLFTAREGLEEPPGHVLDEAGLAAPGRPLQEHGEAAPVSRLEYRDLVGERQVVRRAHPG